MNRARLLLLAGTLSTLGLCAQTQSTRDFSVLPARPSVSWVRDAVIYEIYPRAFSYEGTFAGIERELPELRRLGITVLWLMPIHPVGKERRKGPLGSPYSIQDYYAVNPEFGTLDDFTHLVSAAHDNGFHVIIDLVANHAAWDSRLMREHPEWFTRDSTGTIISPNPDWTDVADLDYRQLGLCRYMIDMMKYWVRDIGIDGFRCDVSEMVPTEFWEDARTALDSIKPVMMLSEGSWPEHHVKAFDLTYSWNTYHALGLMLEGTRTARELDQLLVREELSFPRGSLRLRFSSNHDENAWDAPDVVKYGATGARLAAVVVSTLPGVPLLYNGQEVANSAKLSLFDKISIDWTKGGDVRRFYSTLFHIRSSHSALVHGSVTRLPSTNDRRVYAALRIHRQDTLLVVYNFAPVEFRGAITMNAPAFRPSATITYTDLFTGRIVTAALSAGRALDLAVAPRGFLVATVQP